MRLCNEIIELDKQIQGVVIVNQKGRIIENIMRDDRVTKELSEQKNEMLFMGFTLQMSMFHDFDNEFGPVKYGFLIREKYSILSLPLDEFMVIVFSDSQLDHFSLYKKIIKKTHPRNAMNIILVG
jgi:hypothetical protein